MIAGEREVSTVRYVPASTHSVCSSYKPAVIGSTSALTKLGRRMCLPPFYVRDPFRCKSTQPPISTSRKCTRIQFQIPSGLTLIEVLIAGFAISLLVQLFLAWTSASRESARNSACQNNLRLIGQAIIVHEEARQHAGFAHVDECTTVYKRLQSFY